MAPRFSLVLLLSLLSVSVDARPGHPFHPCNTLIVSTFSFSLLPSNPNPNPIPNPNPNPNFPHPDLIAVVTDLRPNLILSRHHFRHRFFLPRHALHRLDLDKPQFSQFHEQQQHQDHLPSLGFSSLKDRTKDILSVVVSLLFGAACGALTAATMYLIWSLFNHRNGSYRSIDGFSDDDDNDDDNDDIFNPKKNGYVAVPAAPVTKADSIPAPAKESA